MKRLIVVIILLAAFKANAQTNFSGNWKIDMEKSTDTDSPIKASRELIINQQSDKFWIKRIGFIGKTDTASTLEILPFSGKPFEHNVSNGRIKKASITWLEDKKSLKETAEYSKPGSGKAPYSIIFLFTLSDDGSVLTVKNTLESSENGSPVTYSLTLVYTKVL